MTNKIDERYLVITGENPAGVIQHNGDCQFYNFKICTCGLLHDLQRLQCRDNSRSISTVYPQFTTDLTDQDKILDKIWLANRRQNEFGTDPYPQK
jgi:hypothetical protein